MTGVWRWFSFRLGFGMFPLLLSLEIFTSRSSELCLSETVGSSVGSAPEPVDRDRHGVVELLSHRRRLRLKMQKIHRVNLVRLNLLKSCEIIERH